MYCLIRITYKSNRLNKNPSAIDFLTTLINSNNKPFNIPISFIQFITLHNNDSNTIFFISASTKLNDLRK